MSLIPTRLLVLQRLGALLEEVTFEYNEEELSLKDAVFRGRRLIGDESKPYPIVSILESPQPDIAFYASEDNQMLKSSWTLLIQGIMEDDKLNPLDPAYYLHAAVEKQMMKIIANKASGSALYPEHYMLGNLISSCDMSPPVVRAADDKTSAAAFFFLPVRVGILARVGEPYTQVP